MTEYKRVLQKIENTKIYNNQLTKIIANQKVEQASIQKQIASIKETNEGIVPFMLTMLSSLDVIVKNDIPFLPEERSKEL